MKRSRLPYRGLLGGVSALLSGRRRVRRRRAPPRTRRSRYALRRRTRVGATAVRKRRANETVNAVGEYSRVNFVKGKKRKLNVYGLRKIISQNLSSTVYNYRGYGQFGGTNGQLQLLNTATTTTTGTYQVPLHMWEITSASNVVNNTVTNPNIRWTPTFSAPTNAGTISWTNDSSCTVEASDWASTIVQQYPGGNDTLDWVSAKLLFYAPTTISSRISVQLVQLKDTRLVPDSTTGTTTFAAAFYQNIIKQYAYSPMEPGNPKYPKYFKVLWSNTFILDPKESTEAVNTVMREVNVFCRLNRRCTYDWEEQDKIDMQAQEGPVNTGVNNKTQVHPRARIFLMIRGQSKFVAGSAFSSASNPSYDICLRMKNSQLSS